MNGKQELTWTILLIQAFLCLGAKPKLKNISDRQTTAVGQGIVLSCEFESKENVSFTWLKDGQKIQFSSRRYVSVFKSGMQSLFITKAKTADKGVYTCECANSDGTTTGKINVDILGYKPQIQPISDVYLKVGASHQVECKSAAIPTLVKYSWQKKGGSINRNSIIDSDNVLKIVRVKKSDIGSYECIATNSEGTSRESFSLYIAEGVSKWIKRPESKNVTASDKFEWVASITTLKSSPVFKWYKDGSHILRNVTFRTEGTQFISTLKFPHLSFADAGRYEVIVEKLEISELRVDMTLTVFAPPVVLINEGEEVMHRVDDSLSLICKVEANPASSVAWHFNGAVLVSVPANGEKTKELRYQKDKLTTGDMGEYMCKAVNAQGNGTASVNVIVEEEKALTAVKITVIIIVCCIVVALIIAGVFFYCKYGETCFKVAFEHTFYSDLVQEEQDMSSLGDLENSRNTIKKNINMSIRRNKDDAPTGVRRLSSRKPGGNRLTRQTSIFDTINAKQPMAQHGSVFETLRNTLTFKRSLSATEGHDARLASINLCQGKRLEMDQLTFDEVIAEGEYGGITKGTLLESDDPYPREVSIKMLKDDLIKPNAKRDMLTEIRLMRRIESHRNIVEFIGWCVSSGCVCIVEEYLPFGTLLEYLRAQTSLQLVDIEPEVVSEAAVNQEILISYAQQIVSAMQHLSHLQIVHRDLACRNVLISYNKTVKVSDHAIQQDIYTPNVYRQTTGGQLPVRWMAYEAIFNGEYSEKSDVWSFGILLWELCTLGSIPYPNIMRTEQLLEELAGGYRMENPGNISTDLFLLLVSCWDKVPDARPTFNSLYASFTTYLEELDDLANKTEEEAADLMYIDVEKILGGMRSSPSDDLKYSKQNSRHLPVITSVPEEDVEEEDEATEKDPII